MSMNLVPGATTLTADGVLGQSGVPQRVYSVKILSGGTAGVVNLRDGTTVSGTIIDTLTGEASTTKTFNFQGGQRFPNGCYYDEDANVTSTTIVHSSEF